MNLNGMSAKQCCEMIMKDQPYKSFMSEELQVLINMFGGEHRKVSNIERRLRESDNVRSVKVKGKNYVKYMWNSQQDD